ncbi:MAG: class I tRNA ligase family protein, partial [Nitrospira sp.]
MSGKQLDKTYEPQQVEDRWYKTWIEQGYFHATLDHPEEPYTIVIPPPNVTGSLHIGHALNNTLQDIQVRLHRMKGYVALWMPGTDHAGIATQAVVEKRLRELENKTRHDLGREQ